jgi:hypothetical protein
VRALVTSLVITVVFAFFSALGQTIVRAVTRPDAPDALHANFGVDDRHFYGEWVVSGSLALGGALVAASYSGKTINSQQIGLYTFLLVAGIFLWPYVLRIRAHDPSTRQWKTGPSGRRWLIASNAVGMVLLLAVVGTGVSVYGIG